MPLSICAIGNSNLATGKQGWNAISGRYPDVEVVFFAAAGDKIMDLEIADGRLVPKTDLLREKLAYTSKGKSEIEGTYDRYLIWGLPFGYLAAVKAFITGTDGGESDEAICDGIREKFAQCMAVELFRKVRAITAAPIAIVPPPLRSENKALDIIARPLHPGEESRVSEMFETSASQVAAELGFVPLFQPKSTLANGLQTKAIYCVNRAAAQADGPAITHMNAEFGAVVFEDVLGNRAFMGAR